jgi:ABC-type phosphate/phosphonate transport system substrate-binding protein
VSIDQGGAPLRFASFLAPNLLPVYRVLAERIGGRLGRPVEVVVGTSFDQFERGEADLGVICGLPYVWLAAQQPPPVEPLAAPVLAGKRYGGRPVYYSDVIVHRDTPSPPSNSCGAARGPSTSRRRTPATPPSDRRTTRAG